MSMKQLGSFNVVALTPEQQKELDKRGLELQIFSGDDKNGWRILWIRRVNGFYERGDSVTGDTKESCLLNLLQLVDEEQ